MSTSESFESASDDASYFDFILKLRDENRSRYELQAEKLLQGKRLQVNLNGVVVDYRLTPKGCSYSFFKSEGVGYESWVRTGWSRSAKLRALPNLFAESEASALLED